jgi:hypothetical protein
MNGVLFTFYCPKQQEAAQNRNGFNDNKLGFRRKVFKISEKTR